ncbi:flagellar brake protein [Anaeroselena agilis]|uniref:PilZ domain-containing protein n=1 Tax=Anaeroselena agilis TaxID=3063788 RepID=A0ABU3NTM8_9FIRM|nr:PilZ domain-containing protein [Selenomonadales bacterium 4137-cl]
MKNFHVPQKIDLIVEDPDSKQRLIYSSRIEDIGAASMTIAAPYRRGAYLPPWPGRKLSIRVAADSCAYLFNANLLQTVEDPIPLWIISPPADLKKIQMRSYVRIHDVLDVKLELIEEQDGSLVIATLTKDISAGGLRVALNKPLPPGAKLKITLPLPGVGTIETLGEVIRDIPPEEPGERHAAAIEFKDIKERERGEIVKYIFRKQVERRKKEQELFG